MAKAKTGRPTKYDPIYCEMLIRHMEGGLSYESFAGSIRVCRTTLYEWEEHHPEFSYAKSVGRELERLFWEKAGIDGLYNETIKDGDGMTITKSINSAVWIFNCKNRLGWRDKQDVITTDTSTDTLSKEVAALTEELKRIDADRSR